MSVIEEIWRSYLSEQRENVAVKEDRVLSEIIDREEQLRNLLGAEKEILPDEYNDRQTELCSISETNAFIRGVRFAVHFLAEAWLTDRSN